MRGNANRTILVVVSVLLVVTLALVVGSGSCSAAGGGGGGAVSAPSGASSISSTDAIPTESALPEGSYKELSDQLEAKIDAKAAQEGANGRDAASSTETRTVSETAAELGSRGFSDVELTASFALDGTYLGDTVIDLNAAADDKYPSYKMTYMSPSNVEWLIASIDGNTYAATGAIIDSQRKWIVLSEIDSVVKYNGLSNRYSDYALNGSDEYVGVRVQRVDKSTLDSYTPDMLRGLL